ncbi:ribonuclease T2 family protein [Thiocystis violacea]|uniref:ribonuclease T2 family protein n=1 Tax=Thiocystis violacea TaxID=13725 RepID=UPI00190327E9|nr:ribonuclease I [Thiocystis violacea]MBK1719049.1 ribonuclease I [Thiocystis violacea]
MRQLIFSAALFLSVGLAAPTQAQEVNLKGYFIALKACEATKKKDRDNPGNIRLEPRRAYDMIGRNATPGSHYRILVPGAPLTEARWVPMGCGAYAPKDSLVLVDGEPGSGGGSGGGPGGAGLTPDSIELVLAASWQPGFCATSAGRDKAECRSQTAERHDASHFSLHGLWPDDLDDKAIFPCYCGRGAPIDCSASQDRDAGIDLSSGVMARLEVAMPGVRSGLHRREWPKHGACYEADRSGPDAGTDPDEYFSESLAPLDALNASGVRDLFVARLGEILTRDQIESAFDDAFGAGAGERVLIRCARVGGENIITELWISLNGDIGEPAELGRLIQAAPPTSKSSHQRSCAQGRVTRVAN